MCKPCKHVFGPVPSRRLGLIQFGSRCDLYLPLTVQIRVQPGDRVVAGETVVATRPLNPNHS